MQVTQTSAEGLKREFKVVMDAAEIEGKLVERLAGMQQTVQLPGFRPGKVPVSLLRQRFGKSALDEVVQEALNSGASEAIKDGDLRPAMQPTVEVTSFDEGADLEYTITLEVLPVIEPPSVRSAEYVCTKYRGTKIAAVATAPQRAPTKPARRLSAAFCSGCGSASSTVISWSFNSSAARSSRA